MQPGMEYFLRVRYYGTRGRDSGWSTTEKFSIRTESSENTASKYAQPVDYPSYREESQGDILATDRTGQRLATAYHGYKTPGAVYVFRKSSNNTWIQEAVLPRSGLQRGLAGFSLDMNDDGSHLVVGVPLFQDRAQTSVGTAIIFQRKGENWGEVSQVLPLMRNVGDQCGYSVSIAGMKNDLWVAVGAPGVRQNHGQVYLRHWNGETWAERGSLSVDSSTELERFGFAVKLALNGQRLFVAAISDQNQPVVRIFQRQGLNWQFVSEIPVELTGPPHSLKLSTDEKGTRLVISTEQSLCHVHVLQGGVWSREAVLDAKVTLNKEAAVIRSIAMDRDGKRILIGVPGQDKQDGVVLAYLRSGNYWYQDGTFKHPDAVYQGRLGHAVTISGSGNTFFASSPGMNAGNGGVVVLN